MTKPTVKKAESPTWRVVPYRRIAHYPGNSSILYFSRPPKMVPNLRD